MNITMQAHHHANTGRDTDTESSAMQFDSFVNPAARPWVTDQAATDEVLGYHRSMPEYQPTPLYEVPSLAALLGVGTLLVKDESSRLGLPSFKMLGASWATAYAVRTHWLPELSGQHSPAQLGAMLTNHASKRLVAATDGNHGRGVARMAKLLGIGCLILVPETIAAGRIDAIAAEGAQVRIVPGSYDDAIRAAAGEAHEHSLVISDTSWPGYHVIPAQVTRGYSTLFAEIDTALEAASMRAPSTVIFQAGVGSFAAAGIVHYRAQASNTPRPHTVIVEPRTAACLLRSARAGQITLAPPPHRSRMDGLNCGLPSTLSWPVVQHGADLFVAIEDEATCTAMRHLAAAGIVAGESGAAGLGAALTIATHGTETQRHACGLHPEASVLVINTEGATDPAGYRQVVHEPATQVRAETLARMRKLSVTDHTPPLTTPRARKEP